MKRNGCGHGILTIIPQYLAGETKENHKNPVRIITSVPAEIKIKNLLNTSRMFLLHHPDCFCAICYKWENNQFLVMKPISLLPESDLEGVCQISQVHQSSDSWINYRALLQTNLILSNHLINVPTKFSRLLLRLQNITTYGGLYVRQ